MTPDTFFVVLGSSARKAMASGEGLVEVER
jgi:hypothetical protein